MSRTIQLDHTEVVAAVQRAMFEQLRQDGRLHPDAELGLMFYTDTKHNMQVDASVMVHGRLQFGLNGDRRQICPPVATLALSKLSPEERRQVSPAEAEVRFQNHRSTKKGDNEDSFTAEVQFQERQAKAG